jgi:hypothetical protein
VIARILAVVLLPGFALAQNVVHYATTNAKVKYLFATVEPVLHLKSSDILDTKRAAIVRLFKLRSATSPLLTNVIIR